MPTVARLKDKARARLVTVFEDVPLEEIARVLHAGTDIIAVCDRSGALRGIISKTDMVAHIATGGALDRSTTARSIVKVDAVTCRLGDQLHDVWQVMHSRDFKNIPLVDADNRPLGIVNARDALQALLDDTENEEALLRNYVMGVGYR